MEINSPIVVIVILALAILVVFLVKRNMKDEKKFEKDLNGQEKTEVHKEDSI